MTDKLSYLYFFIFSFGLSIFFTLMVKKMAETWKIFDIPTEDRKIHLKPIPLIGGLAIFLSFSLCLLLYQFFINHTSFLIPLKTITGIIIGGSILIIGGIFDDKYSLPPKILWIFPGLAAITAILFGVGDTVKFISNPFGNPINLQTKIFFVPISAIFLFLWYMGMIFTTKFLDGLDGLCAGVSFIGGLALFFLSLLPHINQPTTATLAVIFCGSILGFLFFNFNPAKIFLGEGGSTYLGFVLASLSVILGGKIATALLVMGIPILDVAWVIVRRLWYGKSPFKADRKHLHFRLLDLGFSQKQSVLILWLLSAIFGLSAVFLQTWGKLIALVILFTVMLILAISLVILYKRKHPHIPSPLNDIQ